MAYGGMDVCIYVYVYVYIYIFEYISVDAHMFMHMYTHKCIYLISVQFSSVAQSCLTPCDLMNCSIPGLPVHHQFPKFTQTHVHQVGDAIQPSHLLFFPSPPAPQSLPELGSFPMSQLFP